MKRTLSALALVLFILSLNSWAEDWAEEINASRLEELNGLRYEEGKSEPFTGKAVNYYENGHIMFESNFKDGILDGFSIWWNENGKKKYQFNYKDGKPDGLWVVWEENGRKAYERHFMDGIEIK